MVMIQLNEIEKAALSKKAENPTEAVRCPSCGGVLDYRAAVNSYEVNCKTVGCIKLTSRVL